ncbi:MAG: DM13 domain-containing protein [Actinomycetota bacterium]|nr:DM13 domain-containing protein [Actinomycetota bacterium]
MARFGPLRLSRRTVIVGGLMLLIVVAIGLWWFEPQALLIDERVDEAFPGAEQPTPDEDKEKSTVAPGDFRPDTLLAEGSFRGLSHSVRGTALLIELGDGSRFVRFEDFEVENGPDLKVYLSAASADGSSGFTDDFVDLGDLKGNVGDQNYRLPTGISLERYQSVVVWCRRFSVGFAVAPLEA